MANTGREEEMELSPEVIQELDEVFCSISNTGDVKGYVMADKLQRMMVAVGLSLPPALVTHYQVDGKKEKIYFENYSKSVLTCATNDSQWLDEHYEHTYLYFAPMAVASKKKRKASVNARRMSIMLSDKTEAAAVLDTQELHAWLTNLGEHIDINDVESQLRQFMPGETDEMAKHGMSLPDYLSMARASKTLETYRSKQTES